MYREPENKKPQADSNARDVKYRAYIDIETTGLSWSCCDLTMIGIALENTSGCRVVQLYEEALSSQNLLNSLRGIKELYSYNGSRFDLPFISAKMGVDLKRHFHHTDLMYDCWRNNLKGGLKAVERKLGIYRRLSNIDGYMAVQLWYEYINGGSREALDTLLEYNREDVMNLRILRNKLLGG